MFQKILIANRGEIAVRIIRACRELGITSVAVYSTADKDALHTQLADEAICIGKAAPADSYLNMERILSAAIASKAEAIHPGFGFLSENAKFAQMCEQCHIAFIGPSAEVIRRMGNKQEARNTMINAKVPVVPGTKEAVYTADYGLKLAEQIGFPVMILTVRIYIIIASAQHFHKRAILFLQAHQIVELYRSHHRQRSNRQSKSHLHIFCLRNIIIPGSKILHHPLNVITIGKEKRNKVFLFLEIDRPGIENPGQHLFPAFFIKQGQ